MSPRRLDRAAIVARLEDQAFDRWVLDALMDAFEPAAMAAMSKADKARAKAGAETKPARRPRMGAPAASPEEADHD